MRRRSVTAGPPDGCRAAGDDTTGAAPASPGGTAGARTGRGSGHAAEEVARGGPLAAGEGGERRQPPARKAARSSALMSACTTRKAETPAIRSSSRLPARLVTRALARRVPMALDLGREHVALGVLEQQVDVVAGAGRVVAGLPPGPADRACAAPAGGRRPGPRPPAAGRGPGDRPPAPRSRRATPRERRRPRPEPARPGRSRRRRPGRSAPAGDTRGSRALRPRRPHAARRDGARTRRPNAARGSHRASLRRHRTAPPAAAGGPAVRAPRGARGPRPRGPPRRACGRRGTGPSRRRPAPRPRARARQGRRRAARSDPRRRAPGTVAQRSRPAATTRPAWRRRAARRRSSSAATARRRRSLSSLTARKAASGRSTSSSASAYGVPPRAPRASRARTSSRATVRAGASALAETTETGSTVLLAALRRHGQAKRPPDRAAERHAQRHRSKDGASGDEIAGELVGVGGGEPEEPVLHRDAFPHAQRDRRVAVPLDPQRFGLAPRGVQVDDVAGDQRPREPDPHLPASLVDGRHPAHEDAAMAGAAAAAHLVVAPLEVSRGEAAREVLLEAREPLGLHRVAFGIRERGVQSLTIDRGRDADVGRVLHATLDLERGDARGDEPGQDADGGQVGGAEDARRCR